MAEHADAQTNGSGRVAERGAGTSAPAEPMAVVEEFIARLERLDIEAAMELAAPAIVYQNVPFAPVRGRDSARRVLDAMARYGDGFEVVMHNIAAEGNVVLTERTDILKSGRFEASFWVCGTFEVEHGQIVLWRDRFDFADMTAAFLKGGVRALASLATGR